MKVPLLLLFSDIFQKIRNQANEQLQLILFDELFDERGNIHQRFCQTFIKRLSRLNRLFKVLSLIRYGRYISPRKVYIRFNLCTSRLHEINWKLRDRNFTTEQKQRAQGSVFPENI